MKKNNPIISVDIDDSHLPPPTPEIEQERRLAIFDLLEENEFSLVDTEKFANGHTGPFALFISVKGNRLTLSLRSPMTNQKIFDFILSLNPFQKVIKEYSNICASYFDAVKCLPPSKIEAIDMARRGLHNEGGELVLERLSGKIDTDLPSARRLFTLLCVLQLRD